MPTGDKPVFCSECFEKRGGNSDSRRFDDRGPRRPSFASDSRPQNNTQLEAINTKLDKILAIIENQPEKPIVIVKKKTKTSKKTAPTPEE